MKSVEAVENPGSLSFKYSFRFSSQAARRRALRVHGQLVTTTPEEVNELPTGCFHPGAAIPADTRPGGPAATEPRLVSESQVHLTVNMFLMSGLD